MLLVPLSEEFGWTTDEISSALALRFALYGLIGPFAAIFMLRYGLRTVMSCALILLAGGLVLAVEMTQFWHLVVLWGLMLGVASGMTALVLGAVVSNRWFEKRRGVVVGMLTASTATGQLLFLPLAAWLVETYGWRASVAPVSIIALCIAALAWLFMRNDPRDVGIAAFGAQAPAEQTAAAAEPPARMDLLEPLRVLWSVRGNQTFWLLFGTFFICGLSTNGLIQTHFIALCGDFGLSPVPAASVLAMMGAFDFVGTILSGWLSDRYDNRKLLFWYYGLRGLSLLWLPSSEFTFYGLSFFAMFYGLDWVATVPPTIKIATDSFGKVQAGMIFGWVFAGHQIGAATAAYGAGLTRTLLLTYSPALYAAGTACLIAAIMALMIRRRNRPAMASAAAAE